PIALEQRRRASAGVPDARVASLRVQGDGPLRVARDAAPGEVAPAQLLAGPAVVAVAGELEEGAGDRVAALDPPAVLVAAGQVEAAPRPAGVALEAMRAQRRLD